MYIYENRCVYGYMKLTQKSQKTILTIEIILSSMLYHFRVHLFHVHVCANLSYKKESPGLKRWLRG